MKKIKDIQFRRVSCCLNCIYLEIDDETENTGIAYCRKIDMMISQPDHICNEYVLDDSIDSIIRKH